MAAHSTISSSPRLQINEWNCEYRGEGNANIVIRFMEEKKVLRLVKNMSSDIINLPDALESSRRNGQKKVQVYREYVKDVMQKLLGGFVSDPELVEISEQDIRIINKILEGKHRGKNQHDCLQEVATIGILLPDFCDLPLELSRHCISHKPVLAVEIKPKQGFISVPFGRNFLEDTDKHVCRYCMKQSLKLKMNDVAKKSGYCPLDLFSGCPVRMASALRELLKNPQNNLRIFKDKEIAFNRLKLNSLQDILSLVFDPSPVETVEDQFIHLVTLALLQDMPDNFYNSGLPQFCNTLSYCSNVPQLSCVHSGVCPHVLPKGCVLNRILQAQSLGQSEVDLVCPFIRDQLQQSNMYLEDCYPKCIIPEYMGLREKHYSESISEFQSRKVWEFLVSMTARDCSVMIAFQQIGNSEKVPSTHVIKDKVGNLYLTSIAVVDLDPKSVDRVQGVFRLNQDMKDAHLQCT